MSKPSYLGANVEVESDTFASFINKVNLVIDDMAKTVVTVAPVDEANTTNGALSVGNAHIQGVLSADTGVFDEIRGGTMGVPATMIVSSNVVPKSNTTINIGNTTNRIAKITSNDLDTANLTANIAEIKTANINNLTTNTLIVATTVQAGDVAVSGNVSANVATVGSLTSGDIEANTINTNGDVVVSGNLVVQGITTLSSNAAFSVNTSVINNLTVMETAQLSGTVTVGNSTSGSLVVNAKVASDLVPDSNTRNIGSSTGRFANVFANTWNGALTVSGNEITINGATPTIRLKDTDVSATDFFIQANGNEFIVMSDTDSNGTADAVHPLRLTPSANTGYLFGAKIWTSANDGVGSGMDAEFLAGQPGSYYLDASSYSASDVLTKLKTVDGASSGLDADLLDGQHGTYYRDLANSTGTLPNARLTGLYDGFTLSTTSVKITGSNWTSALSVEGTAPSIYFKQTDANPSAYIGINGGAFYILNDADGDGVYDLPPYPFTMNLDGSGMTYGGSTVWTAGNDGAASGLDADLLDGQHGTYYLDLANSTGTLPDARISGAYSGITTLSTTGTITVRTSASTGYVSLLSGGTTSPGYIAFYNEAGLRAGYVGAETGTNLRLMAENGYTGWHCQGTFTATGDITAFSDARLKSEVETITDALGMVNNMRGVRFTKDGKRGIGVIAQEMRVIAPELVQENEEMLSVAYGNTVGILIEAIKELTNEVEVLKGKLEAN